MPFAQLPISTPEQLGSWMVALAGFMVFFWIARQLWVSFFPAEPKKPPEEYATKSDFGSAIDDLERKISVLEDKIEIMAETNRTDHQAIADSTEKKISDLHAALNGLGIRLEVLNGQVAKDVGIIKALMERSLREERE